MDSSFLPQTRFSKFCIAGILSPVIESTRNCHDFVMTEPLVQSRANPVQSKTLLASHSAPRERTCRKCLKIHPKDTPEEWSIVKAWKMGDGSIV